MTAAEMKQRTKTFAIETAKLVLLLESSRINNAYLNQLIRCSSSVGANYRAAQRAKSTADFINKLKIVEEETDESIYFLELLSEFNATHRSTIQKQIVEGEEILRIIVASLNTVRQNLSKRTSIEKEIITKD
jgi:four helix bundle protein